MGQIGQVYPPGKFVAQSAYSYPNPFSQPIGAWSGLSGRLFVVVSAVGEAETSIMNAGADFGPDTPGTQTSGIQEVINYVVSQGGGIIYLQKGMFNIVVSGLYPITIPFNVPLVIIGQGRGLTVLQAPLGFFIMQSGNTQNTAYFEMSNFTMKSTQSSSSQGGWFFVANSSYGWSNFYIHDIDMYGGGNVGSGTFNIGSFGAVQGGAPLTNVYLKNLYHNTLGQSNGNEAYTFSAIYSENFVLDNVTFTNTSGPGVIFFLTYGGIITYKNSVVGPTGSIILSSQPFSTTPSTSSTNQYTKLILDNIVFNCGFNTNGGSSYQPIDLIIRNSIIGSVVNPVSSTNVTFHSIVIDNVFFSEEFNSLVGGVTAELIKLSNVVLPNNNNQNAFAATLLGPCLPYQSMTINIEVTGLFVGSSNQMQPDFVLPANTSTITAQYNIKWQGMGYPLSGYAIGNTSYNDPNGFLSLVNAFSSYFLSVDYEYFDIVNNILYKVKRNPNLPATPAVPASGTAQENTNSYPVAIYLSGGAVTEVQRTTQGKTYTLFTFSTATALSGQMVKLEPGDTITLTYTTAPSWVWVLE